MKFGHFTKGRRTKRTRVHENVELTGVASGLLQFRVTVFLSAWVPKGDGHAEHAELDLSADEADDLATRLKDAARRVREARAAWERDRK